MPIITQDNQSDNKSGIRTHAIEIVNVFEMEFHWEKDISKYQAPKSQDFDNLICKTGPQISAGLKLLFVDQDFKSASGGFATQFI